MTREKLTSVVTNGKEKAVKAVRGFRNGLMCGSAFGMALATGVTAHASDFQSVTISADGGGDASQMMGKVIGILLTITRYVGVALVIYGVYEIIMSFMQNQPEAKTKGIIMALAGVVMIALKSVLQGLGIVG